MLLSIKMKLLIGGKSRNIYMRKDGSAYYKSGGENVDASYMFKKNGGGLKKQYIGGVQNNLGKVEQKKRSNRGVKQFLGGAGESSISFAPITVDSVKLVDGNDKINDNEAKLELQKLCYIALNGLSISSNKLKTDDEKDKIKTSIAKTASEFIEYLDNNIKDESRRDIYADTDNNPTKLDAIKTDFKKNDDSQLKKLGFTGITDDSDDSITVTRAYVLNKILLCFEGDSPFANTPFEDGSVKSSHSIGVLKDKQDIIDPKTGEFAASSADIEQILDNIVEVLKLSMKDTADTNDLHPRVRNLHTILFTHEKIGAPAQQQASADD